MTREQAKEYLSAVRAGEADTADLAIREALELLQNDAELARWFAWQREVDDILIEKFSSIRSPDGLRENILASLEGKVRSIQRTKIAWLALAATVVVAALGLSYQFGLLPGSTQPFRKFRSDALAMVSVKPGPRLDLETASLETAETYIDAHQAPRLARFPEKLQGMPTAGCRVFLWNQHKASLTCFSLPSGKFLHLVVIREEALGGSDIPSGPYSEAGWHVMFQKKDGLVLMWASQAPMEELKELVVKISSVEGQLPIAKIGYRLLAIDHLHPYA
jgi:hypothetical protein